MDVPSGSERVSEDKSGWIRLVLIQEGYKQGRRLVLFHREDLNHMDGRIRC